MTEVLGEHTNITEERNRLTQTLGILQQSSNFLQRDPDLINMIPLDDKLERDLREEVKESLLKKTSTTSSKRSGEGRNKNEDAPSSYRGQTQFIPPDSGGDAHDRTKRESINMSGMRQNIPHDQQPLITKSAKGAPLRNLFGDC